MVVLLCAVFIRCIGWWCCSVLYLLGALGGCVAVLYLLGALGGGVALCCIY